MEEKKFFWGRDVLSVVFDHVKIMKGANVLSGFLSIDSFFKKKTTEKTISLKFKKKITEDQAKKIIRRYPKLREIDFTDCQEIKKFSFLTRLTQLQSINLSRCSQVHETDIFFLSKFVYLESLDLSYCFEIASIHFLLKQANTLKHISLMRCPRIEGSYMELLSSFTHLESLNMSYCIQIRSLYFLSSITSLKSLDLSYCQDIKIYPEHLPTQLQNINLSGCSELKGVSFLSQLIHLRSIDLSDCYQIKKIPSLQAVNHLRSINLNRTGVSDISCLLGLSQLQAVKFSKCNIDRKALLRLIGESNKINQMVTPSGESLDSIDDILMWLWVKPQKFPIQSIRQNNPLTFFNAPEEIHFLEFMPDVEQHDLESILRRYPKLKKLDLTRCCKINDLSFLAELTELESIVLQGCTQLNDDNFSTLVRLAPQLTAIDLTWCDQIKNILFLKDLISLQRINLRGCFNLAEVSVLNDLKQLQSISLWGCHSVKDFSPLSSLIELEEIDLGCCEEITDISFVSTLPKLKRINLFGCKVDEKNWHSFFECQEMNQLIMPDGEDVSSFDALSIWLGNLNWATREASLSDRLLCSESFQALSDYIANPHKARNPNFPCIKKLHAAIMSTLGNKLVGQKKKMENIISYCKLTQDMLFVSVFDTSNRLVENFLAHVYVISDECLKTNYTDCLNNTENHCLIS